MSEDQVKIPWRSPTTSFGWVPASNDWRARAEAAEARADEAERKLAEMTTEPDPRVRTVRATATAEQAEWFDAGESVGRAWKMRHTAALVEEERARADELARRLAAVKAEWLAHADAHAAGDCGVCVHIVRAVRAARGEGSGT